MKDVHQDVRFAEGQAQRSPTQEASSSRLVWVEGIRVLAAVMVLLYHAQLLFTDYGYTPQPTGLIDNLGRIAAASDRLGSSFWIKGLAVPVWFGYQAVDLFILLSGFTTVLSLKGRPVEPVQFIRRRFSRIRFPYWTIAWCSYPILWAIYWFGGHPTYVVFKTAHDWLPFVTFLARLSSFVVGMVIAQSFLQGKGVLFWRVRFVVLLSSTMYAVGWICQFSRLSWIFADLLLPLGLAGLCYAICRSLQRFSLLEAAMARLGRHTYSFFLIHNFVVDRTVHLYSWQFFPVLCPFLAPNGSRNLDFVCSRRLHYSTDPAVDYGNPAERGSRFDTRLRATAASLEISGRRPRPLWGRGGLDDSPNGAITRWSAALSVSI